MKTIVEETTFDKLHLPEKIYKYRDCSNPKHRRIIENFEIYFSQPFDCGEELHEYSFQIDPKSYSEDRLFK